MRRDFPRDREAFGAQCRGRLFCRRQLQTLDVESVRGPTTSRYRQRCSRPKILEPSVIKIGLILAGLLVSAPSSQDYVQGQSQDRRLCLHHSASYHLPASFHLSGADFHPGLGLLLWSSRPPAALLLSKAGRERIRLPARSTLHGAAFVRGGAVEFLLQMDGNLAVAVLDFDADSAVIRQIGTYATAAVEAASRGSDSWWILEWIESGQLSERRDRAVFQMRRLEPAEANASMELGSFTVPTSVLVGPHPTWRLTNRAGRELFLALTHRPFGVTRFSLKPGSARQSWQPAIDSVMERHFSSPPAQAIGLAALPLDEGIVQTIVDPTSDVRLFLRYDEHGNIVRITTTEAPLGFISSSLPENTLVAAGQLSAAGREVLLYRWRWSRSCD